jgi:hypothetical protein
MLSRELLTQRAAKLAQNAELFAKRAGTSATDRRWAAGLIAALADITGGARNDADAGTLGASSDLAIDAGRAEGAASEGNGLSILGSV